VSGYLELSSCAPVTCHLSTPSSLSAGRSSNSSQLLCCDRFDSTTTRRINLIYRGGANTVLISYVVKTLSSSPVQYINICILYVHLLCRHFAFYLLGLLIRIAQITGA
jgi:hypothetical protein